MSRGAAILMAAIIVLGFMYAGYVSALLHGNVNQALEFEEQVEAWQANATLTDLATAIFTNNLFHGLLVALVPILGLGATAYVAYSTGFLMGLRYLAWTALGEAPGPPDQVFIAWLLQPYAALELAVYVGALALQIDLVSRICRRRADKEYLLTVYIPVCILLILLLGLAAYMEAAQVIALKSGKA